MSPHEEDVRSEAYRLYLDRVNNVGQGPIRYPIDYPGSAEQDWREAEVIVSRGLDE